jgi:hypothetical protein
MGLQLRQLRQVITSAGQALYVERQRQRSIEGERDVVCVCV